MCRSAPLWFLFWLVGTGVALAYGFTLLV